MVGFTTPAEAEPPEPIKTWSWAQKAFTSVQTADGFMWFGTDKGLLRFDGRELMEITPANTPSMSGQIVGALWVDPDESLLVGFRNNGTLARLREGSFEALGSLGVKSTASVQALARDSAGALWVGTDKGLYQLKGGGLEQVQAVRMDVRSLAATSAHVFVAGDNGVLVRATQEDNWQALPGIKSVSSLAQGPDGTMWAVGAQGLFSVHADSAPSFYLQGVHKRGLKAVTFDRTGRLWVGWDNGIGLVSPDRQSLQTISKAGSVVHLQSDLENNLWVIEYWGVVTLVGQPMVRTRVVNEMPQRAPTVFAVLPTLQGTWVSAKEHVGRLQQGTWERHALGKDLPTYCARSLAWDGALWIGTCDGALVRFDGRAAEEVPFPDPYRNDMPRPLAIDAEGTLWIGLKTGTVLRYRAGVFTNFDAPAGRCVATADATLPDECPQTPMSLAPDDRGGTWVATRSMGLLHILPEGQVQVVEDLSRLALRALHRTPDGALWVGTHGDGLVRWKDGVFASVSERSGLPRNISALTLDRQGRFWVASDRGAHYIAYAELVAHAEGRLAGPATHLGRDDGMPTEITMQGFTPGIAQDEHGDILIATKAGLAVISPPEATRAPGAVYIKSITADGNALMKGKEVWLPFLRSKVTALEIHFTMPSFRAPQQVQYEHRLLGHDEQWRTTKLGIARYHNVGPGTHAFQVRAFAGPAQSPTDIAVTAIHIVAFYRRPLFFVGVGLIAFITLLLLHHGRLLVERGRFTAVTNERDRIAHDLHDNLAQHFTALSYQMQTIETLAERKDEGLFPVLRETKKILSQARVEARHAVSNLRSERADKDPLRTALGDLVGWAQTCSSAEIAVTLPARLNIANSVQGHLAHIAQEAVTNAISHGKAARITIDLQLDKDSAVLTIRDEGIGFSALSAPTYKEGHFGLVGMKERARRAGGTLVLTSEIGRGTSVVVSLPCKSKELYRLRFLEDMNARVVSIWKRILRWTQKQ